MTGARRSSTAHALRVLAAPVSVLSLVVLVLNDHVLKQAWPGLVTGKLSDVAGLVVAPLLLAVLLASMGVRRALPVAIGLTGLGFVLAKTSVAGAAATSAVWSLTSIPTLIRADVTDLVALPALGLAWWVDHRVRCSARESWRRTVAVATGMAVLPVAVLGTAATSCLETEITGVSRVAGDFPGQPRAKERRLVLIGGSSLTIDAERAIERELVRILPYDQTVPEQCDPSDRRRCWRILANDAVVDGRVVDGVAVDHSADGGRTWESELELSKDEIEAIRDDTDNCGGSGWVNAFDLGVLPADGEPVVLVPIGEGGVFIRGEDARWELYSVDRLYDDAAPTDAESVLIMTSLEQLPDASPGVRPTPTCPEPSPTTVTPHPSNGPPTTYLTCP